MSDQDGLRPNAADTSTETVRRSWLTRLQTSLGGVLSGLVMVVVAIVLLFWNEGRAVQTERSLSEGAGLVTSVAASPLSASNEGRLVHLAGDAKASSALIDPDFGLTAQGLQLIRAVEMYQWKEDSKSETRKNLGGSEETTTTYSYSLTWSDRRIDSTKFHQAQGHGNPAFRYQALTIPARDAALGDFRLGAPVVQKLTADRDVRIEAAALPDARSRLGNAVHVKDGAFYIAADPAQPKAGDMRVTYKTTPNGPVSIVGQQTGRDLTAYPTSAGDQLLIVMPGIVPAATMFSRANTENTFMTWLLRLTGVIVMFIGFRLIMTPLVVVADLVPFIGSLISAGVSTAALALVLIVGPLTIAIAWLAYRPIVSLIAIAVAAVLFVALKATVGRRTTVPKPA